MKKVVFGIELILFGIALCLWKEIGHISFLQTKVADLVYIILPVVGLGMSVWGLFDKDK